MPRAAFLVRGGYNVLAVDLRGHGESTAKYASPGYLEARDVLGAVHYIRTRGEQGPIAVLGLSYGAVASLLAAEQSPDIAAVIADGAFPTGKDVFDNINRHYLHDRGTNIWLRGLFLISSCPGAPLASSLVYYARTGVYLGPELVSILPAVSRIRVPRTTDLRRARLDCANRTGTNNIVRVAYAAKVSRGHPQRAARHNLHRRSNSLQ